MTKIDELSILLSNAQNLVVCTDLEKNYFDFLHYHIEGIYDNGLTDKDLKTIKKSANAIIKIARLHKEVKSILY
jgi:hypothetical protein